MKEILAAYFSPKGIMFFLIGFGTFILSIIKMSHFIEDRIVDETPIVYLILMGIAMFGFSIGMMIYPSYSIIREKLKR